jgi:ABC-type dipeptide/oligopeptide/nickel transport system permease component
MSAGILLTVSHTFVIVALAQVVLALVAVVLGIHAAQLLNDAVPSAIRAGVSSGVGTFSWMTFLPVSLVFGVLSRDHGVHVAGWLITAAAAAMAVALMVTTRAEPPGDVAAAPSEIAVFEPVLEHGAISGDLHAVVGGIEAPVEH